MFWKTRPAARPDLEILRAGVRDAIAWCDGEPEVTHARAAVLLPQPIEPCETTPLFRLLDDAPSLMNAISRARSAMLAARAIRAVDRADDGPTRGRLALCWYAASLFDAVCHLESHGFLDEDEVPPCATWCGLVPQSPRRDLPKPHPALLFWVPARHVADMNAAIPCCATEVNRWLDDVDPSLARSLASRG